MNREHPNKKKTLQLWDDAKSSGLTLQLVAPVLRPVTTRHTSQVWENKLYWQDPVLVDGPTLSGSPGR